MMSAASATPTSSGTTSTVNTTSSPMAFRSSSRQPSRDVPVTSTYIGASSTRAYQRPPDLHSRARTASLIGAERMTVSFSAASASPLRSPGVDAAPRRHLDGAVARDTSEDHLAQLGVVGARSLVDVARRVCLHLDEVRPVGQIRDVERLTGQRLVVRVSPARRKRLPDPDRGGVATRRLESDRSGVPYSTGNGQIDR